MIPLRYFLKSLLPAGIQGDLTNEKKIVEWVLETREL
jgi:hypothetical protein